MSGAIRPFADDFRNRVRFGSHRPALIDGRSELVLTYGELGDRVTEVAEGLSGESQDGGVYVMLPNSIEHLVIFLAAMQAGVTCVPVSPQAPARELTKLVELVKPCLCLTAAPVSEEVRTTLETAGAKVIAFALDGSFQWVKELKKARVTQHRPGRLLLGTSGSTGEPKLMVFDTDRLWSAGLAFIEGHRFVNEEARFLNILPMSYLGGLFNLGLIPLAAGGSTVITESFTGKTFLNFWPVVDRFDVNVLWVVPTVVRGLLAIAERTHREQVSNSASKVQAAFLGTAPIDLATKTRFEKIFGIPLLENFALSETTFFTSETLDTRSRRVEGSVGERLPYTEIKLASPEGETEGPQEIRVRTPYLFQGYLDAQGQLNLPADEEGYFRTGDLGHFQGDTLVIDGRRRDIIKRGGVFVALLEIENLALQHEAVAEAAAVGIKHDFYGEDSVLFVRWKNGGGPELPREFEVWLHQNLTRSKWPARVEVVTEFPRTPSGKIQKHLLNTVSVKR